MIHEVRSPVAGTAPVQSKFNPIQSKCLFRTNCYIVLLSAGIATDASNKNGTAFRFFRLVLLTGRWCDVFPNSSIFQKVGPNAWVLFQDKAAKDCCFLALASLNVVILAWGRTGFGKPGTTHANKPQSSNSVVCWRKIYDFFEPVNTDMLRTTGLMLPSSKRRQAICSRCSIIKNFISQSRMSLC